MPAEKIENYGRKTINVRCTLLQLWGDVPSTGWNTKSNCKMQGVQRLVPRYDYKCDNCGSQVEISRSFDEEVLPMCTGCNSTMSRVWQATPAHFKGGGWGGKE